MEKTRLKTALESVRAALPTSDLTDSQLSGYTVMLRNRDGELVDKQPLSRVVQFIYNYAMSNAWEIKKALNNYNQE